MRVYPIASGSSGNCIYVGWKDRHFLIDAGVSRKKIVEGLRQIDVAPEQIQALFITHEHSDHISGLRVFTKDLEVPVYATEKTLDAIVAKEGGKEMDTRYFHPVCPDKAVDIHGAQVTPFHISHDAADPVGYTIAGDGYKMALATDLGVYDSYTMEHIRDAQILLLEANHDISMLEVGRYPYQLKRRILGDKGHLSNVASGRLLCEIFNDKMKHIVLAHLSKEHNYPKLAYQTVWNHLMMEYGSGFENKICNITVAKRDVPSEMVTVS